MPTESERSPSGAVIQFEHVSVRYRVPHERLSGLKEYAIRSLQRRIQYQDFWALQDVSFTVQAGEVFGIIGRNGAGKSTLLKVIARVLKPVQGRVVVRGRVAPLLELGGGFHPELTGRENIALNMALLGFSRRETAAHFASIVEFAELGDFIDAPLRTYSTGMVARLGFSVATCFRPDILLVDEILSVGDSAFQEKCLARMEQFQRLGTTLVIVSHSLEAFEDLAAFSGGQGLLLEKGRPRLLGSLQQVITEYHRPAPALAAQPAETAPNLAPQYSSPEFAPALLPATPDGPARLPETGKIYPTQAIFDIQAGSLLAWITLDLNSPAKEAVIAHTDDSRFVLYISLRYSTPLQKYIRCLTARAGGNQRAAANQASLFSQEGETGFPEVSFPLENLADTLPDSNPERLHLLTGMTWNGYPSGKLQLFINGALAGEKEYDSRYDRGDALPAWIAVGLRPPAWIGEIVRGEGGQRQEIRPDSLMAADLAGLTISELRLYRRALSAGEIQQFYQQEISP